MEFHVLHRTRYTYPARASQSYTVVTLQPRSDTEQYCTRFTIDVTPRVAVFGYADRYANDVHYFAVQPEHESLSVVTRSEVVTVRPPDPEPLAPVSREELAADPLLPWLYDFSHESRYVRYVDALDALIAAVDAPPGDAAAWFLAAGRTVHAAFTYDTTATTVSATVAETVRLRRGVCQDYAHVLVAMCRRSGIPARYVSGYIFSGQADAVLGAEASHAWVDAYLGERTGWVGYDPTNDCRIDDRFVKIAMGRDYADVTPVRGVYHGPSQSVLSVDVSVEALSAAQQ